MRKISLLLALVPLFLGGCGTGRLKDNTASVSASTTDIYYQMVLQNLARDYAQRHALPWGIALNNGIIGVNSSFQLGGTYAETSQLITPGAAASGQWILQQQWTTTPVSDYDALSSLHAYYDDVVAAFNDTGRPFLLVQYNKDQKKEPLESDGKTVKAEFLKMGQRNPSAEETKKDPDAGMADTYYRVGTAATSDGMLAGADPAAAVTPKPESLSINLKSFQFQNAVAPRDTISGTFGNTTAYVKKSDVHDLALFTMVILGTIDQIASATQAASVKSPPAAAAGGGHGAAASSSGSAESVESSPQSDDAAGNQPNK
jgi:hypothetical protein